MAKAQMKQRMKGLMMFLPNLISLCGRLMTDRRVPRAEKLLFAGALVYALMPLDLIPDLIPFVGQVDDAYLISLTLLRLLQRTDASVVRENWRGGGDVVELVESVANLAPRLLPKRVSRVLSARVEPTAEGAKLMRAGSRSEALLVALPEDDEAEAGPRRSR